MLPTTAAASPVASCTPAVSSALSAGPGATAIHVNADSPTSPDKARKGKSVTLRVPIPSSPPLISTYLIDSSLSLSLSLSPSIEKRALTRADPFFRDLHNSDKRRVDWKLWIEKMLLQRDISGFERCRKADVSIVDKIFITGKGDENRSRIETVEI